LNCDIRTGFII